MSELLVKSKLGGKRPGAGRKPAPNKLITIQAKVPQELRDYLMREAKYRDTSLSSVIRSILEDELNRFINY